MSFPLRGEIWAVDLNPVRGHEQAGRLPCLVISDDIDNQGPAATHTVLPITSRNKGVPYHLAILPPEGGLRLPGHVMCDDVRSASRERFGERLDVVSSQTLHVVKENLQILSSGAVLTNYANKSPGFSHTSGRYGMKGAAPCRCTRYQH